MRLILKIRLDRTMICVECSNPNIERLFDRYESEYIKLCICPKCGCVVDKYVEYDNVILFIDVMLMKPQAYRHLAFNLTETELLKHTVSSNGDPVEGGIGSPFSFIVDLIRKYSQVLRLMLIMILFEVYLAWAHEEKDGHNSLMVNYILGRDMWEQYLFFFARVVLEKTVMNYLLDFLFYRYHNWGKQENKNIGRGHLRSYYRYVLLVTISTSSGMKLFPILMLIWPYDEPARLLFVINSIASLNMIESLHIVTQLRYRDVAPLFLCSLFASSLISLVILVTIMKSYINDTFSNLMLSEYAHMVHLLIDYSHIIRHQISGKF